MHIDDMYFFISDLQGGARLKFIKVATIQFSVLISRFWVLVSGFWFLGSGFWVCFGFVSSGIGSSSVSVIGSFSVSVWASVSTLFWINTARIKRMGQHG